MLWEHLGIEIPKDRSTAVSSKTQQPVDLPSIEGLDGRLQSLMRIDHKRSRKRIVDEFWPALFFEGGQN